MGKGKIKTILRLYRFEFFDKGEGRHLREKRVKHLRRKREERKKVKHLRGKREKTNRMKHLRGKREKTKRVKHLRANNFV